MIITAKKPICLYLLFAFYGMLLNGQNYFETEKLSFNTQSKELAPAFYQNGLVFCSDRRSDVLLSYTDRNSNPLTNLYLTEQKKTGKFESPRLMAKELTTPMFEGPSSFSRDGKTIFFTRTINASTTFLNRQRNDTTFGIFSAELKSGEWTNLEQFKFNSPDYNTGYPFISDDGLQLFFCSDAPTGFGGFDIYVSNFENGRWGTPVNLGAAINTSKNEVFPFLHQSGRLYFASRGHNELGDLDIYFTVNREGAWQKPVTLTAPFNSNSDDYGLIMNNTSDTGYFVSDRDGSADIFSARSNLPAFAKCVSQQEDDYCYVFYEPNNNELDTTAFAYEWDMGDGTHIRALQAEHCFARPDTYLVQLNIIDKLSREVLLSQATYSFVVEKLEQPYIQAPDTISVGEETAFSGRESYLKDITITNYYWDFDDGFRASGAEVKHIFAFPGAYRLMLGVTGQQQKIGEMDQKNCVMRRIVVVGVIK